MGRRYKASLAPCLYLPGLLFLCLYHNCRPLVLQILVQLFKMPTTHTVGTPSAVNDKLGGIPTLHYLDFSSRGRGQVLRLFFEDAQISYEDVRYSFEEFPSAKKSLIGDLNPTGSVPVVELNGKILTQSYPILRHFARILGEYDGKTEEERYHVDVVCDIAIDCKHGNFLRVLCTVIGCLK